MRALILFFILCGSAYADRLTVASGDPAPETDITTSTLYRGSMSLSISPALAGKNYDVFEYSGTLCFGPAWTTNIARSAAVQVSGDEIVNTASMSCVNGSTTYTVAAGDGKLRGGFRSHVNGQTRSTMQSRLVWEAKNPIVVPVARFDPTASWSYSTDAFRQSNGNAANQIEVFNGLSGRPVDVSVSGYMVGSSVVSGFIGIGIDTSTADSSQTKNPCAGANTFPILPCWARYVGYVGIGYHELRWLERGGYIWVGSVPPGYQTGIIGNIVQ